MPTNASPITIWCEDDGPARNEQFEREVERIKGVVIHIHGNKGYYPEIHDFIIESLARERIRLPLLQDKRDAMEGLSNGAGMGATTSNGGTVSIQINLKELSYISNEMKVARSAIKAYEKQLGIELTDLKPRGDDSSSPLHEIYKESPDEQKDEKHG